jgi:hypothetical protein
VELTPSQTKEETTHSLHAGARGALATFESSVLINQKKKWQYTCGILETSLKEGAVQHGYLNNNIVRNVVTVQ